MIYTKIDYNAQFLKEVEKCEKAKLESTMMQQLLLNNCDLGHMIAVPFFPCPSMLCIRLCGRSVWLGIGSSNMVIENQ